MKGTFSLYNFLPLISIQSPEKSELPAVLPASTQLVPTSDFAFAAIVEASARLLRENELVSEQT